MVKYEPGSCGIWSHHRVEAGALHCSRCGEILYVLHERKRKKGLTQRVLAEGQASLLNLPRPKLRRMMEAQDNSCWFCEHVFDVSHPATIEHLLPLSRGGRKVASNEVAACYKCNHLKGDMLVEEFAVSPKAPEKFRKRWAQERSAQNG